MPPKWWTSVKLGKLLTLTDVQFFSIYVESALNQWHPGLPVALKIHYIYFSCIIYASIMRYQWQCELVGGIELIIGW